MRLFPARVPLELLSFLLERRGQLVTRKEILERVWGKGVFVDGETSINTAVRKLRRALSDDPTLRDSSRRCRREAIDSLLKFARRSRALWRIPQARDRW